MDNSNIGFINPKIMQLYYHITFRIYQLGKNLGLKKFDPFTLACYHGIIIGIYIVSLIGIFQSKINTIKTNEYFFSVLLALAIILSNYYIIKLTGLEKLKYGFANEGKHRKWIYDFIMIFYVVAAFVLINYVRNKNAL